MKAGLFQWQEQLDAEGVRDLFSQEMLFNVQTVRCAFTAAAGLEHQLAPVVVQVTKSFTFHQMDKLWLINHQDKVHQQLTTTVNNILPKINHLQFNKLMFITILTLNLNALIVFFPLIPWINPAPFAVINLQADLL